MTDIADLVAKLEGHDPADDLQWLSGGVGRVLADSERSIVIGRLGERIDFWVEVWPEVRAIVVAAQAFNDAWQRDDSVAMQVAGHNLRAAVRGEA